MIIVVNVKVDITKSLKKKSVKNVVSNVESVKIQKIIANHVLIQADKDLIVIVVKVIMMCLPQVNAKNVNMNVIV